MSNNSSSAGNGIGLGTVLAIVFTVLKLTEVIDWSWWWVLSPLWIPFALVLLIFLVALPFAIAKVRRERPSAFTREVQDRVRRNRS
jgi:TRAP-type C4-dicarboxylate transport system permease small subunit